MRTRKDNSIEENQCPVLAVEQLPPQVELEEVVPTEDTPSEDLAPVRLKSGHQEERHNPSKDPHFKAKLTIAQRLFVFEMIKEINNGTGKRNQTAAAIRAGYSPKSANEQAVRLMADPLIKAEIEKELRKLEKKALLSAEAVLLDIKEIGDRCMQAVPVYDDKGRIVPGQWQFNPFGALKSRELLGKNLELFTDKVKQSGEITINVVVNEENVGKMPKR